MSFSETVLTFNDSPSVVIWVDHPTVSPTTSKVLSFPEDERNSARVLPNIFSVQQSQKPPSPPADSHPPVFLTRTITKENSSMVNEDANDTFEQVISLMMD